MKGTLRSYLEEVNQNAVEMLARLEAKMAKNEGVTGSLKRQDQMVWDQRMNSTLDCAEEVVFRELIMA